jgi:hypothetical protein
LSASIPVTTRRTSDACACAEKDRAAMVDQTANFRIVDIASSPFSRATMLTPGHSRKSSATAGHSAPKLVDWCRLRPANHTERNGLVRVAREPFKSIWACTTFVTKWQSSVSRMRSTTTTLRGGCRSSAQALGELQKTKTLQVHGERSQTDLRTQSSIT